MIETFILENEAIIRLSCFFGIFFVMAVGELLAPCRPLTASKTVRWYSNIGIVFFNSLVVRWTIPILATDLAVTAQDRGWGLLNHVELPDGLEVLLSFIILDFSIYLQHVMFHAIPLFWRLHRMHHADSDIDVTTGARFHPIEIILSMGIKLSVVALLGPPAVGVVLFELILNFTSMFNHGNVRIPAKLDRILRWLVVTPDMHRVHHSITPQETNTNFGFNLPWWDRLFGTYCDQPEKGHQGMTIGLNQFRDAKYLHFHWLLIQPFLGSTRDYPFNKHK